MLDEYIDTHIYTYTHVSIKAYKLTGTDIDEE